MSGRRDPYGLAKLNDVLARVAALHPLQDQIVAGLKREVKVGHKPLFLREGFRERFISFHRINRREAQARQLGDEP